MLKAKIMNTTEMLKNSIDSLDITDVEKQEVTFDEHIIMLENLIRDQQAGLDLIKRHLKMLKENYLNA